MDKIYNKILEKLNKEQVYANEPMSKHTSFKIGGPADIFVKPKNVDELKFIIDIAKKINAINILDLCTGSGIIAVSLAKYIEGSKITAVDISPKAIEIAKRNAKENNVQDQIIFIKSNLYQELSDKKYDIIVSNPPYIKREVIKTLNKQVQQEPKIALDGGYDGLDFYRKIIPEAYKYLKINGYICLEIGYDQKEEVLDIIKNDRKFVGEYCKKDLYDNDRIICAKLR